MRPCKGHAAAREVLASISGSSERPDAGFLHLRRFLFLFCFLFFFFDGLLSPSWSSSSVSARACKIACTVF